MARFVDSKIDFENMSKNKNTSKSTNTWVNAYIDCCVALGYARVISQFCKTTRVIYPKSPSKPCDY